MTSSWRTSCAWFYNLEAAQLDERLRPVEPDYRLVLVGGHAALNMVCLIV